MNSLHSIYCITVSEKLQQNNKLTRNIRNINRSLLLILQKVSTLVPWKRKSSVFWSGLSVLPTISNGDLPAIISNIKTPNAHQSTLKPLIEMGKKKKKSVMHISLKLKSKYDVYCIVTSVQYGPI